MWLKGRSLRDLCFRLTLKTMKALRVSRCCFVFTPRQGTMVVAVVELCLTSIVLFLLLLAAMNTQEIAAMASAELRALESNWLAEFGDKFNLPFSYLNNEKRMLTGQHLASIMMALTYTGVLLSIIHVVSCLMLLYGAMNERPNFLIPWLSATLLSILSVFASLVLASFIFFHSHKCTLLLYAIIATFVLTFETHAALTVFTYFREISYKTIFRDIENIKQNHIIYGDKNRAKYDV